MNELIANQIRILCIFSLTGISIGLIFDFFRIRRRVLKITDFLTYIEDILFWIISGIILIFTIMKYTDGEIRIYMVLGIIIGLLLYFLLISKFIIKFFVSILRFILKIFSKIFSPIKKILKKFQKGWKNKNNML